MQELDRVGIHAGENRRVVISSEKLLIERDLGGVLWVRFFKAVAIERPPPLGVNAFILPQARVFDALNLGAVEENAVGVTAQPAVERLKGEPVRLCKCEAGPSKVFASLRFKKVSTCENVPRA